MLHRICALSACLLSLLLAQCTGTGDLLELRGKIKDRYSGEPLQSRNVIVEALLEDGDRLSSVDAGHFVSDSAGSFSLRLSLVKDARYYMFSFVGDSLYNFSERKLGLMEMKLNAGFLDFYLDRLVSLKIEINRKSKSPALDTLSLYWESGGVYGWNLYPWEIQNYGTGNSSGLKKDKELRWVGGTVRTTVNTRVFADRLTKLHWHLDRYGKRLEISDTITCRREYSNTVFFTY